MVKLTLPLSRLSVLQGLQLINFDPSRIEASKAAILEYNRLRALNRPTLQPFDTSKKVSITHKVSDTKWALSKNNLIAQNKCINAAAIEWNIHGLVSDSSDYVNVILQCLFNSESLRRIFLETKDNSILKRLFELYKSKELCCNDTKELKIFVDKKYLLPVTYDVVDFLNGLIRKLPILQQIYGHEVSTVLRCVSCDERFTTDFVTEYIIPLSLPRNDQPFTLQHICDYNFELWPEVDSHCSNGCMNRRLQGYQIKLLSSSLILKLKLFSNKDKRKIENLKLNQIPSTTILIRNKKFKVLSAIFHQGSNFNSGCYHNMLRQGKHWIEVCNAYVKKSSWLNPQRMSTFYF